MTEPLDLRAWTAANLPDLLGRLDLLNVRIVPDGADKPIEPAGDVNITPEDVVKALKDWDKKMPARLRGILEAKAVGKDRTAPAA